MVWRKGEKVCWLGVHTILNVKPDPPQYELYAWKKVRAWHCLPTATRRPELRQ